MITLILGERSWANVRAMHVTLHLFAARSGLKVNFHKSELVGINIGGSWLAKVAAVLNCKVTTLFVLYVGLPIDGDSRRLNIWEPMANRIKSHLSSWKSRNFSFPFVWTWKLVFWRL